jgi:iron(III) transport system permease protein
MRVSAIATLTGRAKQTAPWISTLRSRTVRRLPLWLIIPAATVAIFELLPLIYLATRALTATDASWAMLMRPKTLNVLGNSVLLSGTVALSAVAIAVPLAWLTTRTNLPGSSMWRTLLAMPLVIPSYVGALVIVAALGPKGIVQSLLEPFGVERLPSIYGLFGSWLTLTLFTFPYVFLPVAASFRNLDPSLEEAARSLGFGPLRTFFTVTLPRLRPAIAGGALLTALYTLGDFGVVTLLRYDAFARAIYVQYRAAMDRGGAAVLAILLVGVSLLVLVLERRVRGQATVHRLGSGVSRRARPVRLGLATIPAVLFCGTVVALSLVLPLAILVGWLLRSPEAAEPLAAIPSATLHSMILGASTALVATICALPVAMLLVRSSHRWTRALEQLMYVGYAMPGIVIALVFVAFGAGTPLYQTLPMLIAACVLRFLPEAVSATRAALLQISPRLEEAARALGRTPAGAAMAVTLPLARSGVLAGAALVVMTTMKELPVTLILSPTGWHTLPIEIWAAANDGQFSRAAGPAIVLIAITALPMALLNARGAR